MELNNHFAMKAFERVIQNEYRIFQVTAVKKIIHTPLNFGIH